MLIYGGGKGGVGVRGLIADIPGGGGVMKKKESPGFRFPEVGISAVATVNSRLLLVKSSVESKVVCTVPITVDYNSAVFVLK